MEKVEKKKNTILSGWGLEIILVAILGYFVYGHSVDGILGSILIAIAIPLITMIVSLVPFVGVIIAGIFDWYYLLPTLYAFTGLYETLLVDIILWFSLAIGVIVTLGTTAIILKWKEDR